MTAIEIVNDLYICQYPEVTADLYLPVPSLVVGGGGGGVVPVLTGCGVWDAPSQLCVLQASCCFRILLHFPLAIHKPNRLRIPPPQELVHELHERKRSSEI